jgi:hypothetical protein
VARPRRSCTPEGALVEAAHQTERNRAAAAARVARRAVGWQIPALPTPDQLHGREQNWATSLLGWYDASGYGAWASVFAAKAEADTAAASSAVPAAVQAVHDNLEYNIDLLRSRGAAAMEPAVPLPACAACGVRSLEAAFGGVHPFQDGTPTEYEPTGPAGHKRKMYVQIGADLLAAFVSTPTNR